MAEASQLLADALHVALQFRIVINTVLFADLGIDLTSERDLLLLGHQHDLFLAAHGIGGTTLQGRGQQQQER